MSLFSTTFICFGVFFWNLLVCSKCLSMGLFIYLSVYRFVGCTETVSVVRIKRSEVQAGKMWELVWENHDQHAKFINVFVVKLACKTRDNLFYTAYISVESGRFNWFVETDTLWLFYSSTCCQATDLKQLSGSIDRQFMMPDFCHYNKICIDFVKVTALRKSIML